MTEIEDVIVALAIKEKMLKNKVSLQRSMLQRYSQLLRNTRLPLNLSKKNLVKH